MTARPALACDQCGEPFKPKNVTQRFCSKSCRKRHENERARGQTRTRTPGTTRPRLGHRRVEGTQLWLTDPTVSVCTMESCFNDSPCPTHRGLHHSSEAALRVAADRRRPRKS